MCAPIAVPSRLQTERDGLSQRGRRRRTGGWGGLAKSDPVDLANLLLYGTPVVVESSFHTKVVFRHSFRVRQEARGSADREWGGGEGRHLALDLVRRGGGQPTSDSDLCCTHPGDSCRTSFLQGRSPAVPRELGGGWVGRVRRLPLFLVEISEGQPVGGLRLVVCLLC